MPPGTNAVLPRQAYESGCVLNPIARGSNVLPSGHDVPPGATLPASTLLRPIHLALMPAPAVDVTRRPRVTADSPVLRALAIAHGAEIAPGDLAIGDHIDTIRCASIAMRPGEHTTLGTANGIPAITLTGSPLDQATTFAILVAPALRRMAGRSEPAPIQATLARKITSELGTLDAVRVRLEGGTAWPLGPAENTGLLAGLPATGLVLIPESSEGYPEGASVPILPL